MRVSKTMCGNPGAAKSRTTSGFTLLVLIGCLLLTAIATNAQDPRERKGGPPREDGQRPASGFGQGGPGGPGGRGPGGPGPGGPVGRGPGGPGPGGPIGRGPGGPGPGYNFLSAEMRFEGRVVKGAPYTATAVSENIQTLADGTRISRKSEAAVARDSEGRTRREQKIEIIGPFAPASEPPTRIFINDVVTRTNYELDPQSKHGRRMKPPPNGDGPPPMGGPPPGAAETSEELLGKQTIEGLEAEGKRSTITIPVGNIGNDRPIVIVSERWESTELQTVVLSKHRDPRFGEIIFRLTGINRAEPDKTLFEVPSDYNVVDGGPPPMRGGGPRRPPQD